MFKFQHVAVTSNYVSEPFDDLTCAAAGGWPAAAPAAAVYDYALLTLSCTEYTADTTHTQAQTYGRGEPRSRGREGERETEGVTERERVDGSSTPFSVLPIPPGL